MTGTLPSLPLSQQFDANGTLLVGAQLYFFVVGTVDTAQNSYSDFGMTTPNDWPLTTDQYGRFPIFWLADGTVHVRLVDASGVVIFDYAVMQVLGPSGGGGGGGGGVDPTTIASTGDVKFKGATEALAGWVKANGTTIGSGTSGASQRANADTQNLFEWLWTFFTNAHCPVGGGRGASAAADWGANKAIGVPDWRGMTLTGLDGMGTSLAGRILGSNVTSGGGDGQNTSGASGGEANHTLLTAEMPAHDHSVSLNESPHSHDPLSPNTAFLGLDAAGPSTGLGGGTVVGFPATTAPATTGITVNQSSVGGGGAHQNMPPFVLGTIYIKL